MKKKKLAIMVDYLGHGGVDRSVHYITSALKDKFDIEIVTMSDSDCPYGLDAPIHSFGLPSGPYDSFIKEIYILILTIFKFQIYKLSKKVEICISFKDAMHIANAFTVGGIKVMSIREHKTKGLRFSGFKRTITMKLLSLTYSRSDLVVVNAWYTGTDLIKNFGTKHDRIVTINNPCDVKAVQEKAANSPRQRPSANRRIVNVGRCTYQKGQWALVRVFAELCKVHKDLELVIVGDGEFYDLLKELAAKLNVESSVHFLGFQDNPFQHIAKSDIFVMTSLWEGFPNVLLEAMACSVPVISTYNEGTHELILGTEEEWFPETSIKKSKVGVVTQKLDTSTIWDTRPLTEPEKHLHSAIEEMLASPKEAQRLAKNALAKVNQHTIKRTQEEWLNAIDTVVSLNKS
jgi:glycosyltransferase involved in cell wall biosynthesis